MPRKRGKRGPIPKEVDWASVKKLAAMQCTIAEIASFLDLSTDTIERASKDEFSCLISQKVQEWAAAGKASLRRKQWLLADKSAAMAIFLGKQILNQKDEQSLNHSGNLVSEVVHYGDNKPQKWHS